MRKPYYLGILFWVASVGLVLLADLPQALNVGLILAGSFTGASSVVMLVHQRMLQRDPGYRVEINDERNATIREKSAYISNIINIGLWGIVSAIFLSFDYYTPAIITAVILFLQPLFMAISMAYYERRL